MSRSAPFSRARAFTAAITAILTNPLIVGAVAQQAAIDALGPYRSRGKGRGSWRSLNAGATRSRYQPHQGTQERIRRVIGGWHTQAPRTKAQILASTKASVILETLLK